MLRHSIGRSDGPGFTNPWGGCLPALPKVAERSYDAWFVVPCWMSG
ncbi:hypothetical protein RPYSC3_31360 [Rhodopseudomonas palustris]|nr:hypothetical protein RPYSC3_31360 [Rhodopseudomonas palustris]